MFNIPFIQVPFGYVLEFFYEFTGSFGLALILFSLAVKLLLLPLSAKSKKSMMKTSRLQPKMKELQIACGDDKQKYQQEVQQLYKDEGVSMFGGCLWSLLPLIIIIPLYNVIREPLQYLLHVSSGNIDKLKEVIGGNDAYWQYAIASDIPGAISKYTDIHFLDGLKSINFKMLGIDLGQTPTWKVWTLTDWNGIGGAIVPVVSGGLNYLSMFVSQKMNNTVVVNEKGEKDPEAAKTAGAGKTMTMLMPLMSVFFGFIMPLGLSVYWIAQSAFGIVQDYFLTAHYRKIYDAEDEVKRQKAAQLAAEEAEKERIRAARRAANPDGIADNMSKKKLQQRERLEREAAAKEFETKKRAEDGTSDADTATGGEENRPYARGRAYRSDRYKADDNKE